MAIVDKSKVLATKYFYLYNVADKDTNGKITRKLVVDSDDSTRSYMDIKIEPSKFTKTVNNEEYQLIDDMILEVRGQRKYYSKELLAEDYDDSNRNLTGFAEMVEDAKQFVRESMLYINRENWLGY